MFVLCSLLPSGGILATSVFLNQTSERSYFSPRRPTPATFSWPNLGINYPVYIDELVSVSKHFLKMNVILF